MDQRIVDLYDRFTHGEIGRRALLARLGRLAGGAAAASALLAALKNDYARAQTVAESDPRIAAETVAIPGVQGLSGYLARPRAGAKHPAVIVIHENRGLNPHIKDVTRRFATEGFVALGVDYLGPLGGTPADEDKARDMFGQLKAPEALAASNAALAFLEKHPASTGKVGAVGFCWGGGQVGALAAAAPELDAAVVYYGSQPPAEAVAGIRAPLLLHYAGEDQRVNAGIPAFEAALKQAGKPYELHMYPGAQHAFNNDTGNRYNKEAAELSWGRTLAFLRRQLGESPRS